jgi:integration host factor subunit beta
MIKSELLRRIAEENPHLRQRDIANIIGTILDQISGAMARDDRVEFRGFGVFSTKRRRARAARNPRTGAQISVAQKRVPAFKPSKEMHERLNRTEAPGRG